MGVEQMPTSLNIRHLEQNGARFTSRVMFLLLLFSSSVYSASSSSTVESIDIQFERSKLQRYEQRIERLEVTIQSLRGKLELLAAEHDSLEVRVQSLKKSLQLVSEKYSAIGLHIESDDHIDMDARKRHADFEIYLAERKYNRALTELNETQNQMSRTTEYLQDRIELLKRNQQGVVWQKQIIRKYRNTPSMDPVHRPVTERLAQAR